MLILAAACTRVEPVADTKPGELLVTVRHGAITAPDSAAPGWIRLRVEEAEDKHIVVAFRLPVGTSDADVRAFVAALDATPATPSPAVALGGPEVGASGEVMIRVEAGVYVLACVRRGDDDKRHAGKGESKVVHVRAAVAADSVTPAAPSGAQDVRLVDFAYVGPDHWPSDTRWLRIENTGKQDHQVRLARLRAGTSVQQWLSADDPDTVATTFTGVARLGAGQTVFLPVELTPGTYVMYCLVSDPVTRRAHVEMGMLRMITVP
ncbi:MAG: hypothetical protein V4813_05795 [Gemmatimonadota bacterium]